MHSSKLILFQSKNLGLNGNDLILNWLSLETNTKQVVSLRQKKKKAEHSPVRARAKGAAKYEPEQAEMYNLDWPLASEIIIPDTRKKLLLGAPFVRSRR